MSIDSSLISLIAKRPATLTRLQAAGVDRTYFVEPYDDIFRWLEVTKKKHGSVPSASVIEARYSDSGLELHRVRDRDLAVLVDEITRRRKYLDFAESVEEAIAHANPNDLERVVSDLQGSLARISVHGKRDAVVDLFSPAIHKRMLADYDVRRRGEMIGIPTGLKRFDITTGGLQKGRNVVMMARTGVGKAQPLSSLILTPTGWIKMGEVEVGQPVTCPDGTVARVTGVYPQGPQEIFKITFSDGAVAEATGDHLWLTETRNERRGGGSRRSVKTTAEIAASLTHGPYWNHYIPLVIPRPSPDRLLPIHPYALGCILGDGHVRLHLGRYVEAILSSGDPELIEEVNSLLPSGRFEHTGQQYDYRLKDQTGSRTREALKKLGIAGSHSWNKTIPERYMAGSKHQRLALLQGLLDTDGCPVRGTSAEYTSVSKTMAEQVRTLVWSLGGVCTFKEKVTTGRLAYRLYITLPEGMRYFRLERKQSCIMKGQKTGRAVRTIRSVEKVRIEEAQCIAVDHPNHLYITNDYVVTHNTWYSLHVVCRAVTTGHKVVVFPLEMSLEETAYRIYTLLSSSMYGADQALKNMDLTLGRITKLKLQRFMGTLEEKYQGQLYIADVAAMSDAYTVERMEAEIAARKPDLYSLDYITLLKAPGVGRDGGEDHTTIKHLSNGCKGISTRHQTVGLINAQVNRDALKSSHPLPRLDHLAYGDAIGQDADQVISLGRRGNSTFYGLTKNRHGPEFGKTRVKWLVDQGLIEEYEQQEEDDED